MADIKASNTFVFYSALQLRELTGLRATTINEVLELLPTVPGSCIYHHTHHFLKRHQYLSPEPPNDFAYWVGEALGEDRIAEQLASVDTIRFSSIRALRDQLVLTLTREREKNPYAFEKKAQEGEAFDFIKSVSVIFATSYSAKTLREFRDCLKKITVSSLYFHIFDARLRLERKINDFSLWIEECMGETELGQQIARLDPYTHTLEGLRSRIISLVEKRLAAKKKSSNGRKNANAR